MVRKHLAELRGPGVKRANLTHWLLCAQKALQLKGTFKALNVAHPTQEVWET